MWLAPPCGTFSRARERPVPKKLVARGAPNPPPLRSDEFPLGLPGLKGSDRIKVARGNTLTRIAAQTAQKVGGARKAKRGKKVYWLLEQPRRSHMWSHPAIVDMMAEEGAATVDFQHCMFGGDRDKWTRVASNLPTDIPNQLSRVCDTPCKGLGVCDRR